MGSCFIEWPDCASSPQARSDSPRSKMLIAATTSAWPSKPQFTHAKRACVLRLSAETWSHSGQVRLVLCGGTAVSTTAEPINAVVGGASAGCHRSDDTPSNQIKRPSRTAVPARPGRSCSPVPRRLLDPGSSGAPTVFLPNSDGGCRATSSRWAAWAPFLRSG